MIAQTLLNNTSASVGPIFKLCSLFSAEWSACGDGEMLASTQTARE